MEEKLFGDIKKLRDLTQEIEDTYKKMTSPAQTLIHCGSKIGDAIEKLHLEIEKWIKEHYPN